jgi:hypothetical protein
MSEGTGPEESPFLHRTVLAEPLDLFRLLNGILGENGNYNIASVNFASALQIAGIINLGFVQDFNNAKLLCVSGYPGFNLHRNQQELGRTRRIVSTCLLHGKVIAQRDYLTKELKIKLER